MVIPIKLITLGFSDFLSFLHHQEEDAYNPKIFNVPESKRIIIGTALGWPDNDSPVNNFKRKRDPVEMFVRWVS